VLFRFEGVDLSIHRNRVLHDVSFEIRRGDFLGVVGPNGSGKTTLLRAVLGLLRPARGRLVRNDPGDKLFCGYVPQRARLDPIYPLRVIDLVRMGRYWNLGPMKRRSSRDDEAVVAALDSLGIGDLSWRLYRDLSGGQQQRTLLARALAGDPEVLVLDEPTNGMDLASEASMLRLVTRLQKERSRTVLFVTHKLNLLANAASRFAILGDGRARVGDRDEMLDPEVLTRFYKMPVAVERAGEHTVIFARDTAP